MKLFRKTFYPLNTWLAPICVMLLSLTMAPELFAATEEVEMSVMFHVGRCDLDTCLGDNSGQQQKPVEMLKNYPSIKLILGA